MTLLSAIEHAAHGLGCGLGRIAEALERIARSLEHQENSDGVSPPCHSNGSRAADRRADHEDHLPCRRRTVS